MTSNQKKTAIDTFVKIFDGSYKRLDSSDIDCKIFDKDNRHISYAEIVVVPKNMAIAYPLPILASRLVKLMSKRMTSVVIWACNDGIIYSKINTLNGSIQWGTDNELICYFDKGKGMKYIRYI